MENNKRGLLIAVVLVLALSTLAYAQIPRKLSVEGRLLDSTNNPRTGTFTFNFSIFDAATGGNELYSELQNVTTSIGLFDAVIGNRTALDLPFDIPYFLEISVSTDLNNPGATRETLAPRRAITSAAYVFNVENATGNFTVKNDIEIKRNATIAGNLTVAQNLTVGSSSLTISGINNRISSSSGNIELQPFSDLDIITGSLKIAGTTRISSAGAGTFTTVTGTTLTDGTASLTGGALTGAATGSFSGALSAATLNTGNGANELFAMDQNVRTTDAVTFLTVDTGQGANELYDMDQNVLTTSSPTFNALTLTNTLSVGGGFGSSGLTVDALGNIYTDGDILFSGNLTTLETNTLRVNGSIVPPIEGISIFDIGNQSNRWRNGNFTGTVQIGPDLTSVIMLDGANNKLGIGTSKPDSNLHVIGSACIETADTDCSPSSGTLRAATLTDGTASLSAGAIAGATSITASGDLTVDTNTLFVDSTNNKVGIRDATPTEELTVANDAVIGGSTSETETLSNAGFSLGGDDLFVAGSAGVEGTIYTDSGLTVGASTIYSDGTVASGTSSNLLLNPVDVVVDCDGTGSTSSGSCESISAGDTLTTVVSSDNLCTNSLTSPTCVWTSSAAGADTTRCTADDTVGSTIIGSGCAPAAHTQVTASSSPLWGYRDTVTANGALTIGASTATSEDIYIDIVPTAKYNTGGNVGIGTSSPNSRLQVSGSDAAIWLQATNIPGSGWRILPDIGGTTDGFRIHDNDAAATRLAIDSSGNVGIGTGVPGAKLDVHQSGSADIASFDGPVSNDGLSIKSISVADTVAIQVGAPASETLYINREGGTIVLRAATTVYTASSAPCDAGTRGGIYFDTDQNKLCYCNGGGTWRTIDESGTCSG